MKKSCQIKNIGPFKLGLFAYLVFNIISLPIYSQSLTQMSGQKTKKAESQQLQLSNGLNSSSMITSSDQTSVNPMQLQQKINPLQISTEITVHILGEIKYPGIYKAKLSDRAEEILKMSQPNRLSVRIIEIRHEGEKTRLFDLYKYNYFGDLSQNPYLKDGDIIFVPKTKGVVKIEGSVNRPAEYELNSERNVLDLIKLAGGFSSGASQIANLKIIRFSEVGKKFVMDVPNVEDDLKNFKIQKGDIVVVPSVVTADKKFDYSVESMPGEKPFYPTSTPEVVVMGQVNNPGPYPFKPHLTIKDYVAYAGPDFDAKLGKVDVMRSGKKMRMSFGERLESGDLIIVKRKMQFKEYISFTSSSLALVLSVLVLENRLNK